MDINPRLGCDNLHLIFFVSHADNTDIIPKDVILPPQSF